MRTACCSLGNPMDGQLETPSCCSARRRTAPKPSPSTARS
ncbi:hypothetical protein E2C01_078255 [Portunus trituberculatus]|uniref:Uncharacterized protein n=1 Tax=Portunus trituberculatus TaxID=210409 RepID=A0A5B7IM59_PORTR|nr:hypothetical protein [Portunus trituberculatus]